MVLICVRSISTRFGELLWIQGSSACYFYLIPLPVSLTLAYQEMSFLEYYLYNAEDLGHRGSGNFLPQSFFVTGTRAQKKTRYHLIRRSELLIVCQH